MQEPKKWDDIICRYRLDDMSNAARRLIDHSKIPSIDHTRAYACDDIIGDVEEYLSDLELAINFLAGRRDNI